MVVTSDRLPVGLTDRPPEQGEQGNKRFREQDRPDQGIVIGGPNSSIATARRADSDPRSGGPTLPTKSRPDGSTYATTGDKGSFTCWAHAEYVVGTGNK